MAPRCLLRLRRALRRGSGSRRGYTLVEMIVAIMLFTIGLLAMAGTASLVTMALAGARTRSVAAAVAESRFDRLRAQTCSAHTSGTAVTRGVREDWTVLPRTRANDTSVVANDISVVVTIISNRRTQTQSFRTYIPC